jgi:hypothetical protein
VSQKKINRDVQKIMKGGMYLPSVEHLIKEKCFRHVRDNPLALSESEWGEFFEDRGRVSHNVLTGKFFFLIHVCVAVTDFGSDEKSPITYRKSCLESIF